MNYENYKTILNQCDRLGITKEFNQIWNYLITSKKFFDEHIYISKDNERENKYVSSVYVSTGHDCWGCSEGYSEYGVYIEGKFEKFFEGRNTLLVKNGKTVDLLFNKNFIETKNIRKKTKLDIEKIKQKIIKEYSERIDSIK